MSTAYRNYPSPLRIGSASLTRPTPKAYDSHCNLVLGDVEETIYVVDDEADDDDDVKTVSKKSEMLFVRGMWATKKRRLRTRAAL